MEQVGNIMPGGEERFMEERQGSLISVVRELELQMDSYQLLHARIAKSYGELRQELREGEEGLHDAVKRSRMAALDETARFVCSISSPLLTPEGCGFYSRFIVLVQKRRLLTYDEESVAEFRGELQALCSEAAFFVDQAREWDEGLLFHLYKLRLVARDPLPDDIVAAILRRVYETDPAFAVECTKVSKEWAKTIRAMAEKVNVGPLRSCESLRAFERSMAFPNLKSLRIRIVALNGFGWAAMLTAIAAQCPRLHTLIIEEGEDGLVDIIVPYLPLGTLPNLRDVTFDVEYDNPWPLLTSLPHITSITLRTLGAVTSVAQLSTMVALEALDLGMMSTDHLDVAHLSKLRKLVLNESPTVTSIANLHCLPHLTVLTLPMFLNLSRSQIDIVCQMRSLEVLECVVGVEANNIGGLCSLPHLRKLSLTFLSPSTLAGVELPGVEKLRLGCVDGQRLPQLTNLAKVKSFKLDGGSIAAAPELEHMTCLEKLHIMDCRDLESLPPLTLHPNLSCILLRNVRIEHFPPISTIRLSKLHIQGSRVKDLPDLSLCTMLRILLVQDSPITELPPLANLTSLKKLYLVCCNSLDKIPPLPPSLESIEVSSCGALVEFPSTRGLSQLHQIKIKGCAKMTIVLSLMGLEMLRFVALGGYRKLRLTPRQLPYPWAVSRKRREFVALR